MPHTLSNDFVFNAKKSWTWISDMINWHRFMDFISASSPQFVFFFDWEDISNTRDSVSPHSKRIEVCQKHSAARRIYNSLLLSIWKCNETRSLLFDMLSQKNNREGAKMRFTFEQK